jgi:hypothetical protein
MNSRDNDTNTRHIAYEMLEKSIDVMNGLNKVTQSLVDSDLKKTKSLQKNFYCIFALCVLLAVAIIVIALANS